jgi:2-keto-3-deoxy-6-phosphogluconate aldolase
VLFGAGTVLDAETARTAILAGAGFIVAPTLNLEMVALCKRYAVPVLPGCFTPTEMLTAWEAGADMVKLFPDWAAICAPSSHRCPARSFLSSMIRHCASSYERALQPSASKQPHQ